MGWVMMTMSCLIHRPHVDDEDAPSRFQDPPDFADGLSQNLGRQVVEDQAADHEVHRVLRKGKPLDGCYPVVDGESRAVCLAPCTCDPFFRDIDAADPTTRSDPSGQTHGQRPGTTPQIKHRFTRGNLTQVSRELAERVCLATDPLIEGGFVTPGREYTWAGG